MLGHEMPWSLVAPTVGLMVLERIIGNINPP
jgi:hypothetical protein